MARTVRYEPSAVIDHAGEMVVTRGDTVTHYGIAEIVGMAPRRWLVSRLVVVGPDTAANRAASRRIDTYTCSPLGKTCTCAHGNISLLRGSDSDCVHVLALSKLLQIGALPNPLERPGMDVANTEPDEPIVVDVYNPWDEFADMVLDSGIVCLS